jgi:hypothetical protein
MTDYKFAVDTSKPLPGAYRMPRDTERRTAIYVEPHYQDVVTVCEMNPDIQEHLDATMKLFCAAPEMGQALLGLVRHLEPMLPDGTVVGPGNGFLRGAKAALKKAGLL